MVHENGNMDGEQLTINPQELLLHPIGSREQGDNSDPLVGSVVSSDPSCDWSALDTTINRTTDHSQLGTVYEVQLIERSTGLEVCSSPYDSLVPIPSRVSWHSTAPCDDFGDFGNSCATDDGRATVNWMFLDTGLDHQPGPINSSEMAAASRFLPILDSHWTTGVHNSTFLHQTDHLTASARLGEGDMHNCGDQTEGITLNLQEQQPAWLPLLDRPPIQVGSSSNSIQSLAANDVSIDDPGITALQPGCSFDQEFDSWEMDVDLSTLPLRRVSEPSISVVEDDGKTSADSPGSRPRPRHRRHSDKLAERQAVKSKLTFVMESGGNAYVPRVKGRRSGPLTTTVRQNARKVRQEKSICIRCRKDRQPCSRNDNGPCAYCLSMGLTAKWSQPCTKASFLDIIESGTCNYISQRAVNHLTADGTRRIRINLPETLNLDELLKSIGQCRDTFNIRARQTNGSLYILNLDRCHDYLSSIRRKQSKSNYDLRKFIDSDILKAQSWQDCVYDCNPLENLMSCLSIWGNMPSRASYSFISHKHTSSTEPEAERQMDVEHCEDREAIIMAAQLSRIVCRKLEVDAYSHLQQALNHWSKIEPSELLVLVRDFGLVLLTLRWRVSWWTLLGDGGSTPDPKGREAFAYRVHRLCRVLYFYYCMLRRKLPHWHSKKDLDGVWSTYPDTTLPVFEEFPNEESIEGFEAWMLKGQELIATADVAGKLANMGLRDAKKGEKE